MNLPETIDTLVIGAGQAGIAMSEHLSQNQIPHIVLEKARVAEAWRTRRWDSLVANGPCWHDRFPGLEFEQDPNVFVHHDQVAAYFEQYAEKIKAPIYSGIEVLQVKKKNQSLEYQVETNQGTVSAKRVIVATGPFQKAIIPSIAKAAPNLLQMHSDQYKNPEQLPEGAVLVVGAGSSGVQIADELNRAGKTVFLSVGQHERPPRNYRGRDNVWWLGVLGGWDAQKSDDGPLKGFAVSGAHNGHTVDFKKLANQGITLVGKTQSIDPEKATFAQDLAQNIAEGEQNYLKLLAEADQFIAESGIDLPEDPDAKILLADPPCITEPLLELNFKKHNIQTIIWASGFGYDYDWLQLDVFNDAGKPKHNRGVTDQAGIYFIGLPYLSGRGSSFIWGVWYDAKHIAEHIAIKQKYLTHNM